MLYTDDANSEITSSERTLRHGELKLLRSLKRSYKQNDSRKPKQLKMDDDNIRIEDDKEDEEIDIKDVEFRMKNDFSKVNDLVNASTACSYKDLMMLKLILCSGLYPQFASSDEFNYCKVMTLLIKALFIIFRVLLTFMFHIIFRRSMSNYSTQKSNNLWLCIQ